MIYTLTDLRASCEKYLSTRPDHRRGFCWWACSDARDASSDDIYAMIYPYFDKYRGFHPELWGRSHVSPENGCVPARVEFVAWMRDQIQKAQ